MSRSVMWFGALQFVVLLQGVAAFLWFSEGLPRRRPCRVAGVLLASLWAIGAVLQGRIRCCRH
jgi:alkylglycerol monooxygenase